MVNTYIIIPTYNEAGNIGKLIEDILKYVPEVKILVVDDNSPDGTIEKVRKYCQKYSKKVFLLIRKQKKGRGNAGIEGFKYVLDKKAEVVVEMDADFSHHPRYLPQMLKEIKSCDVVVGSRFVLGGKDCRGWWRRLITIVGGFYIRKTLGLSVLDCTSGYRAFKREVLEKVNINTMISKGPSIVQEILYKADILGYKIKEIPIIFVDRKADKSKFNYKIVLQNILIVLVLKFILSDIWREEIVQNG